MKYQKHLTACKQHLYEISFRQLAMLCCCCSNASTLTSSVPIKIIYPFKRLTTQFQCYQFILINQYLLHDLFLQVKVIFISLAFVLWIEKRLEIKKNKNFRYRANLYRNLMGIRASGKRANSFWQFLRVFAWNKWNSRVLHYWQTWKEFRLHWHSFVLFILIINIGCL